MLGEQQLVGFVGVSDLDAAREFYGGVLGLELRQNSGFSLIHETAVSRLWITLVEDVRAAPYTVLGWQVDDLAAEVDVLVAAGVTFNTYEGMEQDERGIWTAPSGARIAWFSDPDGNTVSLQA